MAFPDYEYKIMNYGEQEFFSLNGREGRLPLHIDRIPTDGYRIQGGLVTPESLVRAFKSRVVDRVNWLRNFNNSGPMQPEIHEFLSDIIFVNYDRMLYTAEEGDFRTSPAVMYKGPLNNLDVYVHHNMSYTPEEMLGNPVVSSLFNDTVYHKHHYDASNIEQLGDYNDAVRRVYDMAANLATGERSDVVNIANTLNALDLLTDQLSCIRLIRVVYADKNGRVLNNGPRIKGPYTLIRENFGLSSDDRQTQQFPDMEFFAIMDPHYKNDNVLRKYMVPGEVLSEANVYRMFDQVACDLINNILKYTYHYVFFLESHGNSFINGTTGWHFVYGRTRGNISYVHWNGWSDVAGNSGFLYDFDINGRSKNVRGIRMSLQYEHAHSAWVSGAWIRVVGINKVTGQEDDYGRFENSRNQGQSLVLWHPPEGDNRAYSQDLWFTKSIPPTHRIRIWLHSGPGDNRGDSFHLRNLTLDAIYYE